MVLTILLALKFSLFTYLIKVQYFRSIIVILSSLISIIILNLIYSSKMKRKDNKALGFYIIISIILLLDATYFAQFNTLPSVISLKLVGQLTAVGDSIKMLLKPRILLLILDIPFVIYAMKRTGFKKYFRTKENKSLAGLSFVIVMGIFAYIYNTGGINLIKNQELYSYHFFDIKNTIVEGTGLDEDLLSQEDIEELRERSRLKQGNFTGIGKGKNLIVIQVEGLQDFVIDLKQGGREISPVLNKLSRDKSSLYYDEYFQLLGRGNTSDSEFVSHNSLHPSMEEPTYDAYYKNTFYGLPWLLRDNGYNTWAFHGYEKEFWNRADAYPGQGFERFISQEDFEYTEEIGFGIKDEDFFQQSLEYMKEMDSLDDNPFYAFLVTLTSHTPFRMPGEYHVLDIEEEYRGNMIGDYLQSIHYTDGAIGAFIEDLKREGLYDNSVIVIYGDHFAISATQEEAVLMDDLLGREYDFDEMMNIPLIIHVPGEELGDKISRVGSMLDFYPTIANIMGYDNEKGLVFGRDLNNYQEENLVKPQTYMLKGSFISKDILFEISRDGVFKHSRAVDRDTREILDVEDFEAQSKKIMEEIDKSDFILKRDYFKDLAPSN